MSQKAPSATANSPPVERRGHARLAVLGLLATGTVINYLDRAIVGISAPAFSKELGIDAAMMGVIFSAFSWSYVAMQVPGGILLDRFGARITYFVAVLSWSLSTLLHGLVLGINSLLGLRLLLGAAEAPCFPTNSRVVATWFPQHERARATGIYTIGEYVGLAFLSPLLFLLLSRFGWRPLFVLAGVLGVAFSALWWRRYREPRDAPSLGAAELAYIEAGGGLGSSTAPATPFNMRHVCALLRHRQVWAACIGQFASNATLLFFLNWFPTYLATERHLPWVKMGMFSILPFTAAALGVVVGSLLSDRITRRCGNASRGCKLPIASGLLLSTCIVIANYCQDDRVMIAILSLAFFGQGMASLGWTVISNIAPRHLLGLTGGLFNLAANLAGIIVPLLIGAIVTRTGSFFWALFLIGALALAGAISYGLLLGDVKRLELD